MVVVTRGIINMQCMILISLIFGLGQMSNYVNTESDFSGSGSGEEIAIGSGDTSTEHFR